MTTPPPERPSPPEEQFTTALPRSPRGRDDARGQGAGRGDGGGSGASDSGAEYQETTILRRPKAPPAASNVPGAVRSERRPARERTGAHLPPYAGPELPEADRGDAADSSYSSQQDDAPRRTIDPPPIAPRPRGLRRTPRKLTVTRVAALRSRELTHRGLEKFHGAVSADGADRSGLGQLTYAVMGNYAVDAALAVALANTLFFAAAKAESTGKVLLYLLLTVAPFAIIAPLIGPALDKLQHGRRIALAASSVGRSTLAVVMALNFDSWIIYPCALGMLVLSKGFGVLKAALTPRVLPEAITLVKTNSRLSVFGLIAGGVSGGIAVGIAALTDSSGALWFTATCGLVGAWLCLRIPAWVESTEGELPIHHTGVTPRPKGGMAPVPGRPETRGGHDEHAGVGPDGRRGLPRTVAATLWANSVIRVETGFLALFIAFVIKTRYQDTPIVPTPGVALGAGTDDEGWMQLLLLAAIGAAAGAGGFVGNALGARLTLRNPQVVALGCLGAVIVAVVTAFIVPGLVTAGVVAFVGSTASSLAKVCLDATIQLHLPESSRASAFGRSESVLQLSWVFGGVIGLLIGGVWALGGNTVYLVGFGIVGGILILGFAQCVAVRAGRSLVPSWQAIRRTLRRRKPTAVSASSDAPVSGPVRSARKAGRPR